MVRRVVELFCGAARFSQKSGLSVICQKSSHADLRTSRREAYGRNLAFGLTELLVVLALIGLLAAVELSLLSQSRTATHSLACLNNLKQIQLAWMQYANDNNDSLVANAGSAGPIPGVGLPWVASGDYDQPNNPACTNVLYLVNPSYAALATYVRTPAVYRCPADRSSVTLGDKIHPRSRSYTLNTWLGVSPFQLFSEPITPATKLSEIRCPDPANRFAFMDTHPGWIYDVIFIPPMPQRWTASSELFYSFPAAYHNGAACLSFADGHAEKHRWRDRRTTIPESIRTDDGAYPQPSQSGNPDIRWLEQRGPTQAR
jgi:type II secretory pathway pseudopilin PulG